MRCGLWYLRSFKLSRAIFSFVCVAPNNEPERYLSLSLGVYSGERLIYSPSWRTLTRPSKAQRLPIGRRFESRPRTASSFLAWETKRGRWSIAR
ncbi:hypothetical protein BDW02DRAFT_94051 [Decorospora gaudefroyi]|uniref:Secreted protein n=1 Tax=Decorospora gaudefroyi TaxID=184978 RepID=A0A6A5K7W2_9PLEO|nr:hypothetical protein BDW02DRAFT_94051 [Decorospora gaudefroyi]